MNNDKSADVVQPFQIALPESDGSFVDIVEKVPGVGFTVPAEETSGVVQSGEERSAVQEDTESVDQLILDGDQPSEQDSDSSESQSEDDESYESASESERSSSLSPAQRDPAEIEQLSAAHQHGVSREKRV